MSTAAQFLRRVSSSKRGCGPCPLPKGTGGATAPICATKAKLVILEARIFAMTPIETSQSSSLAGTLTPEALFLSGFDPETVHPKNVRTAGVCGESGSRWRLHGFYPACPFVPRKPPKAVHKGRTTRSGVHTFPCRKNRTQRLLAGRAGRHIASLSCSFL